MLIVYSCFACTQAIEERTGVTASTNGTAAVNNYFSPVYVNAPLARDRDTDSNGNVLPKSKCPDARIPLQNVVLKPELFQK